MANLLQRGSDWLQQMRHKHAVGLITYQRGGDSVELEATVGRTVFEVDDGTGLIVKTESRDYLIRAADLVLAGSVAVPQRGDRIREVAGDQVLIYEVLSPGNEPEWRWSDPYRKTLRVHTKQVDVEVTP